MKSVSFLSLGFSGAVVIVKSLAYGKNVPYAGNGMEYGDSRNNMAAWPSGLRRLLHTETSGGSNPSAATISRGKNR